MAELYMVSLFAFSPFKDIVIRGGKRHDKR